MPEQESLEAALSRYDRQADQQAVAQAEQERQQVLQHFPLETWPELPLERYALGQGNKRDCFCWWLEFGTPHVGSIKGGNARKHIIYKQQDGTWYYPPKFPNEQEAWRALRSSFVEAFTEAQAGVWEKVGETEGIALGPALSAKSLYCYFPNDVLPIGSIIHIRHFLALLGSAEAEAGGYEVVRLNRILLQSLRQRPEFNGWTTKELERFLYHWADPRDQRRAVKIAPGENASLWEECVNGGYIRVGWGEPGDLRDFDSFEAFRAKFSEKYGEKFYKNNQSKITKKSKEAWTLRDLEPGDLVVANHGTSKVLAVGEVIEPGYEWKEHNGDDWNNIVHVKWDTSYAQDIPPQKAWAMATVAPMPQTLLSQIMTKKGGGTLTVDPVLRDISDALERKGQAVLYGPPGTRKTWYARRFAVWWLMRHTDVAKAASLFADTAAFAEAEQKLSTAQVGRRVWWVVANPKNWSWDRLFKDRRVDYSYGRLQRNYPLVRNGDLVVGYQSTPDKRIVALAKIARQMYTAKDGDPAFDLEPLAHIDKGPTYDELQGDDVLGNSEPMRFRCQGTLFALTEDEFDHLAGLLVEKNPDLRQYLDAAVRGVGPLTRLTFHPSYSCEDFIEGFRPVEARGGNLALRLEDGIFKRVCREAQANPRQPYLVLIDEINRANVAKVFGELITLLEKDKRGMLVSLPQSKEPFTIPPNVYVLGTMNTADRSIKLLDAALRRRFAFIELMPNSLLLEGGKVGNLLLDEFLDELNHRIAAKEGREKQIGHSFLLEGDDPISEPEEFARRFRQEILPLLQEYCYEDYGLLAGYIGEKLVNKEAQMLNDDVLASPDQLIKALEDEFSTAAEA
jgi:5-methylcytosine-specific restriction enzyme B